MVAKGPGTPVAVKLTGEPFSGNPDDPLAEAVTVVTPTVVPNVKAAEALPSRPVVAEVADRDPLPENLIAKATLTLLAGFPLASLTIATKGLGSVVPTVAL